MLQAFRALGPVDLRNIRRDSMLNWLILMPFVLALVLRFGIPPLQQTLLDSYNFDLTPYYPLVMSYGFLLMPPILFGMMIGFLLLDERDDDTLTALRVTPLTLNNYIGYRIFVPMVLSFVLTILTFPIIGLGGLPLGQLMLVSLMGMPMAPIFALYVANFAKNKVQGFALVKASGSLFAAPFLAFFIDSNWELLFGMIPTYWGLKLYWLFDEGVTAVWPYVIAGLLLQGVVLYGLLYRFNRMIGRGQ